MCKKFGVIGDIHGNSLLLGIALNFLNKNAIDSILAVGDIVDGEGDVELCCKLLNQYKVIAVKGNHEKWFLDNHLRHLKNATQLTDITADSSEYLNNLPLIKEIETPLGLLMLCHGIGYDDSIKLNPDDYGYAIESNLALQEIVNSGKYRFMINGHTHLRMVRKFGNLTIINGGSLKGKYSDKPCFLIVDFFKMAVNFFEFNNEDVFLAQVLPIL
jgi:putative phosphoesterase